MIHQASLNIYLNIICDISGTIRINRFQGCTFSSDRQMKRRGRGCYEEKQASIEGIEIRAIKWFDNKGCSLTTVERWDRWDRLERKKIVVPKPQAVDIYNRFMGGVDLLDGQIAYYRISIRSKKFYMRFCYHFFDMMIINAWNIYKNDCKGEGLPKKDKEDQLDFRTSLAYSLCLRKIFIKQGEGQVGKKILLVTGMH
nr:unnamed protein product [Callosobruchus chinensis]